MPCLRGRPGSGCHYCRACCFLVFLPGWEIGTERISRTGEQGAGRRSSSTQLPDFTLLKMVAAILIFNTYRDEHQHREQLLPDRM